MKILRKLCSSALLIGLLTGGAGALPEGPTVGSGQGSVNITTSGSTQTIQQFTDRAIVNWNSFNIDVGELVNFVQPSSVSAILNRVVGQDPSSILGAMRANGQVFLINPNGVVFGHTANIDVGSLVVSTLGISDQDFLSGNLTFQQEADKDLAAVINHGTIKVDDNGFVVLTGPMVANDGVILARVGQVALAAGTKSTVSFDPTGMIQVELPADANTAEGIVSLSYEDAGDLLASAVSSPHVQAGQIVVRDGRTFLEVESGTVVNAGEIQADGMAGQDAGRVVLDSVANTILVKDSLISAKGVGENSSGGEVYVLSQRTADSDFGSLIDVSGGTSGDGGFVEQSANRGRVGVHVRALAADGKTGTFLIDPDVIMIMNGTGTDDPGDTEPVMRVYERNLETTAETFISLLATKQIILQDLADNALTLPTGVDLTLRVTNPDNPPAVQFLDSSDRIILSGDGNFYLITTDGGKIQGVNVVTDEGAIEIGRGILENSSFTTKNGEIWVGLEPTIRVTGELVLFSDTSSSEDSMKLRTIYVDKITASGEDFEILYTIDATDSISIDATSSIKQTASYGLAADRITLNAPEIEMLVSANELNVTGNQIDVTSTGSLEVLNVTSLSSNPVIEIIGGDFADTMLLGDHNGTIDVGTFVGEPDFEQFYQPPSTNVTYNFTGNRTLNNINTWSDVSLATNSGTISGNFIDDRVASANRLNLQADGVNISGDISVAELSGTSRSGDFTADVEFANIYTGQIEGRNINLISPSGIQFSEFSPNSQLVGQTVTLTTPIGGEGSGIRANVNAANLIANSNGRIEINSFGPNLNVSGGSTYDSYTAFQVRSADSGNGNISIGNVSALGVTIDSGSGNITSNGTIEASQVDLAGNNISATVDQAWVLYAEGAGDVAINKLNDGGELTSISAGNTASYTTPGDLGGAQINGKNLILDVGGTFEGSLSAEGFVQVTADSVFLDVSAAEATANARAGDVYLFAYTDNIAVSANSQNGNVDVESYGNIVQNAISGNTVNILSYDGDITHGSGRVSGNTVTLTANNVEAHTATSNLTVNLGPTGDLPDQQVPRQTDGTLPSGNVTINNDSAALTASIATTGNVDFSNTGALNGNFTANSLKLSGQSVNAGISTGRVEGDATDGSVVLNSNGTSELAVVGSSAPNGDFVLNHSGDVVFDSINARNVTISTPGNITDTANTIIAQGITLNGNNVLVNTQGQVIVINAQGNVTVTNTVVDVSSLSIDANGNVDFGTDGNLHIAQVSGGQLVSLKAGGNISAGPGSYVNGFDVALLAGGTITPDLNAPLQIGATNSILLQAQGGGIAGALQGQLPADAVTIQTPSGLIYYNGILLNGTEILPPALPDLTEVENQIGQQNGLLIDDGSVGSAANDGLVEESATQKLVSQLTETTGGGEGVTTEVLITLEIDALGEVKVELSQPSPFDQTISTSENLSADDVLDLDTEELTEVEVSLYYDAANDQLIMAVNLSADDVLDLDVSEFELIPVNINYQITGDPALMIEHLRANDIIDLHVEELGEIPIKVHVSGN